MTPGKGSPELDVLDEAFHAPGPQEQWSDSLYLGGGDARSEVAFYARHRRWMGMPVDPEHFLLVNNVGLESGAEVVGGCLMLGGELSPIVTGRTEGTQRNFVAHATDELGRSATLRGAAISVAPLRQRRGECLTTVNEGLTRLEWLGHESFGISEWLEQT